MSNLIEKANELRGLVYRKEQFKIVLKDMSNPYYEKGLVIFSLTTGDYHKSYKGDSILFDDKLMKYYLKSEIDSLNSKIDELIMSLKNEV